MVNYNGKILKYSLIKQKNIFFHLRVILVAVLFLVLFVPNSKSQLLDDADCVSGSKLELDYRKKPWKGNNPFLEQYLQEIKYFDNKDKVRFLVPVKFWVYRNNKGEGGSSIPDIKEFIEDLNSYNSVNQTGIQFYISNIKYINNSNRQIFGYYIEATLQSIFRHTNPAINVYLIDGFKKKQESRKIIRGTYNMITQSIILQRKNSSTGLTHEVGHYFGLLHPHRHYDRGKSKQEPVSRERSENNDGKPMCEERGDLLSDTEAEPKLTHLVDNDCQFIGTALKDAWGDNYKSEVNNIMSYPTHYQCRDSFTMGQKSVMLYSASKNKYAKYWNTENELNLKYFFDKNEPDDYQEIAGVLPVGINQAFNFHKIFLGKKTDRNDTCDWIKFEVKSEDKRNAKIVIVADSKNKSSISAVFYDKNTMALSKKKNAKAGETIEIGFQGLVSDWYYIHVKTNETESKQVDFYNVDIELY